MNNRKDKHSEHEHFFGVAKTGGVVAVFATTFMFAHLRGHKHRGHGTCWAVRPTFSLDAKIYNGQEALIRYDVRCSSIVEIVNG